MIRFSNAVNCYWMASTSTWCDLALGSIEPLNVGVYYVISANEILNNRINFPKSKVDYNLLPDFNSEVTIYLGRSGEKKITANLIDSSNGKSSSNARINSVALKQWAESEGLAPSDSFILQIINPTTFRIFR